MGFVTVLLVGLFAISRVQSAQHIESELAQLPKIHHLDDYEKCLKDKNGIFCHGQFQIYSDEEDHPTFKWIQKYAQDPRLYNRSILHHGYCLNKRCPSSEQDLTARFESCVDRWARHRHSVRARLVHLDYCQQHGQPLPITFNTQDMPHRVFLYIVYLILIANFVGTVYDLTTDKDQKRSRLLTAWSVRVNWNKLMSAHENADPRLEKLEGLNGFKVVLMAGAIFAHAGAVASLPPQHNPRFLEKHLMSGFGPMVGALTTCTQAFVVVSSFLTSYNILLASQKHELGLNRLPRLVLKRAIRMYPLYLLIIGYAATFWSGTVGGPVMPLMVGRESAVCRRKFWPSLVFLQNFIEPELMCIGPTWILATDMQLHILVLTFTVLLIKYRRWTWTILTASFAAALALTTHVAFSGNHIPMIFKMTPENFRTVFQHDHTYVNFFLSPVNCVMAAVAGMSIAFYIVDCQEREDKHSKQIKYLDMVAFAMIFIWAYCCIPFTQLTDPSVITAIIPVERMVYCVVLFRLIYGVMTNESPMIDLFRWPPLRPLARMSMAVSMVHWCVNVSLVAVRYAPLESGAVGMLEDTITTWMISYLLAVPLTILVEYPVQKTLLSVLRLN